VGWEVVVGRLLLGGEGGGTESCLGRGLRLGGRVGSLGWEGKGKMIVDGRGKRIFVRCISEGEGRGGCGIGMWGVGCEEIGVHRESEAADEKRTRMWPV